MVGKTVATLQRNVLNDLRDIVGEKNFHWVDKQKGELKLCGRRVYCVGANNEESESKIRGATVAGAYCDEANLYPEAFFAQLMARMSVEGAQCFANCNPDSPYHWFYVNYIMNDKIDDKQIWHFTMDDNLSLSETYRLFLKQSYHGVFYKRFIEGLWVIAEGAIYDMFDADKHVKRIPIITAVNKDQASRLLAPGEKIDPVVACCVSCDYATSSVMSWSLLFFFASGRIYKRAEYYYDAQKGTQPQQKTDGEFLDDFYRWVASYPEIRDAGGIYMVYCDPSAGSWKQTLMRAGFPVYNAKNDVVDGIRVVGDYIAKDMYYIDPDCTNTIMEYGSYSWDPIAQKVGIDKPLKIKDHACDSDRYGIYTFVRGSLAGVY